MGDCCADTLIPALPDQDKDWLNGLVLRRDEAAEHSDIIREGEMPAGVLIVAPDMRADTRSCPSRMDRSRSLGLPKVYANRMLRRLRDENLIVLERRTMRILDLEVLKAAAAFDPRYLHLEGAPQAVRDTLATQHRIS